MIKNAMLLDLYQGKNKHGEGFCQVIVYFGDYRISKPYFIDLKYYNVLKSHKGVLGFDVSNCFNIYYSFSENNFVVYFDADKLLESIQKGV